MRQRSNDLLTDSLCIGGTLVVAVSLWCIYAPLAPLFVGFLALGIGLWRTR